MSIIWLADPGCNVMFRHLLLLQYVIRRQVSCDLSPVTTSTLLRILVQVGIYAHRRSWSRRYHGGQFVIWKVQPSSERQPAYELFPSCQFGTRNGTLNFHRNTESLAIRYARSMWHEILLALNCKFSSIRKRRVQTVGKNARLLGESTTAGPMGSPFLVDRMPRCSRSVLGASTRCSRCD